MGEPGVAWWEIDILARNLLKVSLPSGVLRMPPDQARRFAQALNMAADATGNKGEPISAEVREPASVPDVIDCRCTIHVLCQDKGDYVLPAQCSNCGWKGTIIQTRGHRISAYGAYPECPYCGCREIRPLPQWAQRERPAPQSEERAG